MSPIWNLLPGRNSIRPIRIRKNSTRMRLNQKKTGENDKEKVVDERESSIRMPNACATIGTGDNEQKMTRQKMTSSFFYLNFSRRRRLHHRHLTQKSHRAIRVPWPSTAAACNDDVGKNLEWEIRKAISVAVVTCWNVDNCRDYILPPTRQHTNNFWDA